MSTTAPSVALRVSHEEAWRVGGLANLDKLRTLQLLSLGIDSSDEDDDDASLPKDNAVRGEARRPGRKRKVNAISLDASVEEDASFRSALDDLPESRLPLRKRKIDQDLLSSWEDHEDEDEPEASESDDNDDCGGMDIASADDEIIDNNNSLPDAVDDDSDDGSASPPAVPLTLTSPAWRTHRTFGNDDNNKNNDDNSVPDAMDYDSDDGGTVPVVAPRAVPLTSPAWGAKRTFGKKQQARLSSTTATDATPEPLQFTVPSQGLTLGLLEGLVPTNTSMDGLAGRVNVSDYTRHVLWEGRYDLAPTHGRVVEVSSLDTLAEGDWMAQWTTRASPCDSWKGRRFVLRHGTRGRALAMGLTTATPEGVHIKKVNLAPREWDLKRQGLAVEDVMIGSLSLFVFGGFDSYGAMLREMKGLTEQVLPDWQQPADDKPSDASNRLYPVTLTDRNEEPLVVGASFLCALEAFGSRAPYRMRLAIDESDQQVIGVEVIFAGGIAGQSPASKNSSPALKLTAGRLAALDLEKPASSSPPSSSEGSVQEKEVSPPVRVLLPTPAWTAAHKKSATEQIPLATEIRTKPTTAGARVTPDNEDMDALFSKEATPRQLDKHFDGTLSEEEEEEDFTDFPDDVLVLDYYDDDDEPQANSDGSGSLHDSIDGEPFSEDGYPVEVDEGVLAPENETSFLRLAVLLSHDVFFGVHDEDALDECTTTQGCFSATDPDHETAFHESDDKASCLATFWSLWILPVVVTAVVTAPAVHVLIQHCYEIEALHETEAVTWTAWLASVVGWWFSM